MEISAQQSRVDEQGIMGFTSVKHPGDSSSVSDADCDQDSSVSDSESGVSGGSSGRFRLFGDGLAQLSEGDSAHEIIRRRFVAGMGSLGPHTTVVAVHKNSGSSELARARAHSFQIFSKAVEKKRGGNANVRYAWYAAASKEEIESIVSHGFCNSGKFRNNGLFGSGVYLSPDDSPLECVKSLAAGEDGLRHLLLCRVILGKSEVIRPGSDQFHPSSEEFDSGVDDLSNPKKYIVWSTHMNSHILPEYVISFRAPPSLKGFGRTKTPNSPWMPIPDLISVLSRFLPKQTIDLLTKYHKDHKEKKISRHEMIQRVRRIVGDKMLIAVIKSFRSK